WRSHGSSALASRANEASSGIVAMAFRPEQRCQRLASNLRRLLAAPRRVRRDIEPDLQYVRNRQAVTQDGGPKDGLRITWNSDERVGTVVRGGHHQPKSPQHGLI